ncbi:conserved hypothetical protein [Talaromyces stipitatus ATCC 10500]|uniref:FAD-binding PCMH-type domain-containing protein n=1 Tax=Talaromyces stipitatus (strain ATCC 10500 / CBS 375.48 / QM 6759 / NRRL 1006) TaxID=441959 RepID=B8MB61_TALSN|nr:uncharacterized protein TSTA_125640 [Talaromyces stipitatus ATCC 10500]EED18850.1 conserved hypothetical protein [Talaromyces stipitatus ATCC 10500]
MKSILFQLLAATIATASSLPAFYNASGAPPFFPGEDIQLTEGRLTNASQIFPNSSIHRLFGFGRESKITNNITSFGCKLLPGDAAWPSPSTWDIFNFLLGGSLIKTNPLAAVCYPLWPEYSAQRCKEVSEKWLTSELQLASPGSVMQPLYEGRSCMPPGFNYTTSCEMGAYPTYVVNVSTVAQIQLAVNFARNANLRLVIKNTGHDFLAKSSGKGALSIWTHYLTDKAFYPEFESDDGYTGPAIKVGAGVQTREAYEYAKAHGVTVVGGEDYSVGIAGGFTLGGGHSPMSSMYGMAADQVLAMQVVLASGHFITATAKQNPDIFWMLRGGGGSTIGVVTSMTIKVHPKVQMTTVTLNFTADNDGPDVFWKGVRAYFDNVESLVDKGTYAYYFIGASADERGTTAAGNTSYYFQMQPFAAPNKTIEETKALLNPWFTAMDEFNITYTPVYSHADNFHDSWVVAFPEEKVGQDVVKLASRLMPRSVIHDTTLRNQLVDAIQDAIAKGFFTSGVQLSGTGIAVEPPSTSAAAVLPAWRTTLTQTTVGGEWTFQSDWGTVKEVSLSLTSWMDVLRDLAPDSGAYLNEGDIIEPNQSDAFYGKNYPRLYALKQKYDPTGVFFALTAVGSEDWEVQVTDPLPYSWNNNGRLCRRWK